MDFETIHTAWGFQQDVYLELRAKVSEYLSRKKPQGALLNFTARGSPMMAIRTGEYLVIIHRPCLQSLYENLRSCWI